MFENSLLSILKKIRFKKSHYPLSRNNGKFLLELSMLGIVNKKNY